MAAASSRAITTEAGANLGAITYYFGSKDDLLAEAFVAAIRRLVAPAMDALREEATDPITSVFQAIARLQESMAESADDAPIYLEILIQSRHMPALGQQVAVLFAELRTVLAAQMAEHQARGFLPSWVQPEPMAALLLAVAQGVVLQTTVDPAGPQKGDMASQFAQLLIASGET